MQRMSLFWICVFLMSGLLLTVPLSKKYLMRWSGAVTPGLVEDQATTTGLQILGAYVSVVYTNIEMASLDTVCRALRERKPGMTCVPTAANPFPDFLPTDDYSRLKTGVAKGPNVPLLWVPSKGFSNHIIYLLYSGVVGRATKNEWYMLVNEIQTNPESTNSAVSPGNNQHSR